MTNELSDLQSCFVEDESIVCGYFAAMNAPASEGAVAELSEKHGKSKTEIRRLKREGLLHTLTEGEASCLTEKK